MISEEKLLVRAVVAEPDDDTVRLAYADWLDERNMYADRCRAQYIRAAIGYNNRERMGDFHCSWRHEDHCLLHQRYGTTGACVGCTARYTTETALKALFTGGSERGPCGLTVQDMSGAYQSIPDYRSVVFRRRTQHHPHLEDLLSVAWDRGFPHNVVASHNFLFDLSDETLTTFATYLPLRAVTAFDKQPQPISGGEQTSYYEWSAQTYLVSTPSNSHIHWKLLAYMPKPRIDASTRLLCWQFSSQQLAIDTYNAAVFKWILSFRKETD